MMIDSKVIQKIYDANENEVPGEVILELIMDVIKPKPEFVKGELIVHNFKGLIYRFNHYDSEDSTQLYTISGELFQNSSCRKLDSIPLAPIAHDSADRPEGLDGNDVVMIHFKNDSAENDYITILVRKLDWSGVDKYIKVHFLKGSDKDV